MAQSAPTIYIKDQRRLDADEIDRKQSRRTGDRVEGDHGNRQSNNR